MTRRVGAAAAAVGLSLLLGTAASAASDDGGLCSPVTTHVARLQTWRPPAPHGFHEFSTSVILELPHDVATAVVELWGGGGGGGGGSLGHGSRAIDNGSGGGGGASGTYARGAIAGSPARRYTLIVGQGGSGGVTEGDLLATAGLNGGDSYLCDGDRLLAWAPGGSGGQPALAKTKPGAGGRGRLPELAAPIVVTTLLRPGQAGTDGAIPFFDVPGSGGIGGRPVIGSLKPLEAWGGNGAPGGWPEPHGDATPGGGGSIILEW